VPRALRIGEHPAVASRIGALERDFLQEGCIVQSQWWRSGRTAEDMNLITDSGIRKDSPLGEMRRLLAISTKAGSQLQGLHVKAECKAATDV